MRWESGRIKSYRFTKGGGKEGKEQEGDCRFAEERSE